MNTNGDLVERLRKRSRRESWPGTVTALRDAADEIERLRLVIGEPDMVLVDEVLRLRGMVGRLKVDLASADRQILAAIGGRGGAS